MAGAEPSGRRPVSVEGDSLVVTLPDGPVRLPLVPAAKEFSDWVDEGRRAMYEQLLEGRAPVRFFAQHLPMVVTYNAGAVFPFNCGNKGVGQLPREEHLPYFIRRYRHALEASKGEPWRDSLELRLRTVAELNLDPERVDRRCLATLEIFERQTYQNLQGTPLASLLFTGQSPDFKSFQLNCAVEIVGPGDPRHTFITLARTMFEYDDFHITQHNFPFAYVFWISECISKTPFRVQREPPPPADGADPSLPWDAEALEAIGRAPPMIQPHIRSLVERYAAARGFPRVSLAVVQEARRNLMDGR